MRKTHLLRRKHRLSNGAASASGWAAIFTTSPRCGFPSTNTASRSSSQSFRTGRFPKNPAGKTHPSAGSRPPVVQRGPIDQKTTVRIEAFRRILGDPIYGEILHRIAHARRAIDIPNAQAQAQVADAMERAARGIRKAHSLSQSIGDTQFVSVLDRLRIGRMSAIPNLEALRTLVSELESVAGSPAA